VSPAGNNGIEGADKHVRDEREQRECGGERHGEVRVLVFLTAACLGLVATGLAVEAGESSDLARGLNGFLVYTPDMASIRMVALPSMKDSLVRPASPRPGDHVVGIEMLSGPDGDNRLAFIETDMWGVAFNQTRNSLKTIQVDGTGETTIVARAGDDVSPTYGGNLSLAGRSGKVALVRGKAEKQLPFALFFRGELEIWDVNDKHRLPLKIEALNQPTSWFPDGRRIAYVDLVARDALPKKGIGIGDLLNGDFARDWKEFPAVYILDIETGRRTFCSLGSTPIVSADGKTVFVGSFVSKTLANGRTVYQGGIPQTRLNWKRVEVSSGKVAAVNWPLDPEGQDGAPGLIANPSDDIVVYWGRRTPGEPQKRSRTGSFRSGLELQTIKLAIIDSQKFQTILPAADPRHCVSFGLTKSKTAPSR
jgi:hypothetical protein